MNNQPVITHLVDIPLAYYQRTTDDIVSDDYDYDERQPPTRFLPIVDGVVIPVKGSYDAITATTIVNLPGGYPNTHGFNLDLHDYSKSTLAILESMNLQQVYDYRPAVEFITTPTCHHYGVLDEDEMVLQVFSYEVDATSAHSYCFVGGAGVDGGFGDYSNPHWGDPLVSSGMIIAVNTREEAQQVMDIVNKRLEDDFYKRNPAAADAYSGEFPYEIRESLIPGVLDGIPLLTVEDAVEKLSILLG